MQATPNGAHNDSPNDPHFDAHFNASFGGDLYENPRRAPPVPEPGVEEPLPDHGPVHGIGETQDQDDIRRTLRDRRKKRPGVVGTEIFVPAAEPILLPVRFEEREVFEHDNGEPKSARKVTVHRGVSGSSIIVTKAQSVGGNDGSSSSIFASSLGRAFGLSRLNTWRQKATAKRSKVSEIMIPQTE